MMMKRALVSGAVGLGTVMAVGVVAPAEAAPRQRVSCAYSVDEAAGTLTGSCSGRLTATFSGSYTDGTAAGTFTVDTWMGDLEGTFTGTGFDGGTASGSYSVTTWFGTFAGTFGATAA